MGFRGDGRRGLGMSSVQTAPPIHHKETAPADTEKLFEKLIEFARALDKVHEQGMTHNDIKPGNLLITPSGEIQINDWETETDIKEMNADKVVSKGFTPAYSPYGYEGLGLEVTGRQRDVFGFIATAADLFSRYRRVPPRNFFQRVADKIFPFLPSWILNFLRKINDFLFSPDPLDALRSKYRGLIFENPGAAPQNLKITEPNSWPKDIGEVIEILQKDLAKLKSLPASVRAGFIFKDETQTADLLRSEEHT